MAIRPSPSALTEVHRPLYGLPKSQRKHRPVSPAAKIPSSSLVNQQELYLVNFFAVTRLANLPVARRVASSCSRGPNKYKVSTNLKIRRN